MKFTDERQTWHLVKTDVVLWWPYLKYHGWLIRLGFEDTPQGYLRRGYFATKGEEIIPLCTQELDHCVDILQEELNERGG